MACDVSPVAMFIVKVEFYAYISNMSSVEQMTHIFLSDVVLLLDVQA